MAAVETVHMPDAGGNTITMARYKGRLWPPFPGECIKGVEALKSKDNDVMIMAYPKSGTHWLWEIARMLLAGTTDVPAVEKESAFIESVTPEELEAIPSPRLLNSHTHFELLSPETLIKRNCKLIYVSRDPRDVAVSYYNHHRKQFDYYGYKGEWKDYFPLYIAGKVDYETWFSYTRGWERGMRYNPDLQVHVTSYEALQENRQEEIERLALFLTTPADNQLLAGIAKKTSFSSMRSTKVRNEPANDAMYRKGVVGDWKNWFTVAQNEQFEAIFEKEMKGTRAYELYSNQKSS